MDILAISATSFLVGLSGALIPGPMLTVNITESLRRGFWAGPLIVVGHGIAELLLLIGIAFGLGQVLQIPWVGSLIGISGGIVMLWIAYGIVKSAQTPFIALQTAQEAPRSRTASIVAGGVISVSNPTWIIWWATIGITYVVWASAYGALGLVAFFGGHILSDLAWYSLVSFLVSSGRQLIGNRVFRAVLICCGLFLCGLSVYFIFTSVQRWLAA